MKFLALLFSLISLSSFGATVWPASTNANQTFYGVNVFSQTIVGNASNALNWAGSNSMQAFSTGVSNKVQALGTTVSNDFLQLLGGTVSGPLYVPEATATNSPATYGQLLNSVGTYRTWVFATNVSTVTNVYTSMVDLSATPPNSGTNIITITGNNQYIGYVSPAAGLTSLKAGTYSLGATMRLTGSGGGGPLCSLSGEIYIRKIDSSEVEITPVSGTAAQAIGTSYLEYIFTLVVNTNVPMAATDSVLVKFKTSNKVGTTVTLNITAGSFRLPIPSSQFPTLAGDQTFTGINKFTQATRTPTNSSLQTVDFNKSQSDFQTNAAFAFLGFSNISMTDYNTAVVIISNSTGSAFNYTAPANCHTMGTLNVTNVTIASFACSAGRWTNLLSLPQW